MPIANRIYEHVPPTNLHRARAGCTRARASPRATHSHSVECPGSYPTRAVRHPKSPRRRRAGGRGNHRGVRAGWKLGTYPESDLRATKDGVIVTFHDKNFARVVKDASPELEEKGREGPHLRRAVEARCWGVERRAVPRPPGSRDGGCLRNHARASGAAHVHGRQECGFRCTRRPGEEVRCGKAGHSRLAACGAVARIGRTICVPACDTALDAR